METVPANTWRRILHDAALRPGNVKAWLRMGWPKHPLPGQESDLVSRLSGLNRKLTGGAVAVARYLQQERLVESNGNGRFRITAAGCARAA